ncbi:bifunctional phosphoribosyl-AMP cyclohydrolase/phosphoribosyl-ATP diphosphatase HisIE [Eisenibacter elegans]|uniref:bifunctional phosphoribosyl-AMP cyclohydrolase/phosphoribosyl-ATP diphosphatase HisIE n=1 Tax=Eisenibacter elegans TaxID=997 RepID=UPI00042A49EE|nr:bifunctional phosphoribosyl-AMP cyclohydrolase/phosphoribosyl-ATP diphosphatase HisIE [Eisenibacter elegans]
MNFDKNADGLIPAIIQDAQTRKVLMLGYMNAEAYAQTKATGIITFFSRSKQRLWVKGETSGNYLHVVDMMLDCDEDTLLVLARPVGPVCHTGTDTCFKESNQENLWFLESLQGLIASRALEAAQGLDSKSYTVELFRKGVNKIAQKVGEEAVETVIEATNGTPERLREEAADLLYHLLVLLQSQEMRLQDIIAVLQARNQKP